MLSRRKLIGAGLLLGAGLTCRRIAVEAEDIPGVASLMDNRVRQLVSLYRYAKHELGDLLDGVSFRLPADLEVATIIGSDGIVLEQFFPGGSTPTDWQSMKREAARISGTGKLSLELYGVDGLYVPRERRIYMARDGDLGEMTLCEEIGSAALNLRYDAMVGKQRRLARQLDETMSYALGIELLGEFHADRGSPLSVVEAEKSERYGYFIRKTEDRSDKENEWDIIHHRSGAAFLPMTIKIAQGPGSLVERCVAGKSAILDYLAADV